MSRILRGNTISHVQAIMPDAWPTLQRFFLQIKIRKLAKKFPYIVEVYMGIGEIRVKVSKWCVQARE